jgi:hypothetical protein
MKKAILLFVSIIFCTSLSHTQTRYGVTAGMNLSTLGGSDVAISGISDGGVTLNMNGPNNRTGLAAGVFFEVIASENFCIHQEVLYSMKGATYSGTANSNGTNVNVDLTMKYDYLDLPVLLQYTIPISESSIRPMIFAGPSLGILISSKANVTASANGMSSSAETDINDQKRIDIDAVAGAGVVVNLDASIDLEIGLRYGFGFASVDNSSPAADIKNRYFGIMAGIIF